MLGISITAIGMRPIQHCLEIAHNLRDPLTLQYIELAIGSLCPIDWDYGSWPLILHDSCLYQGQRRLYLNPLVSESWIPYKEFIANHDVRAVSLHPPLQRYCSKSDLEAALTLMEKALGIPVMVEIMPSPDYWCSSWKTLVDHSLLLDVSHVLIWHQGRQSDTQETCLRLLQTYDVGALHLSHNRGFADNHELIPSEVWFASHIEAWSQSHWVTYESLPKTYAQYERLDKRPKVTPQSSWGNSCHKDDFWRKLTNPPDPKIR